MERAGGGAVAAEFDAKAARYETHRLAGWYRAQNEAVLAALPAGFAGTLVDVGCGTGWLLRQAASNAPGLVGVGIDLSSGMIRRAREQGAGLTFLCADWESVALESLRACRCSCSCASTRSAPSTARCSPPRSAGTWFAPRPPRAAWTR